MALDPETFGILLDTVERFVTERLVPLEAQVAEEDQVPAEIIEEMKELGLFSLSIPEEYGGLGLSMSEEIEVAIRLGGTTPAFRSVFGTNAGIGSQGIVMDGTDAQKEHYLPKLATGEMIASFALTEPEAGSDAGSLKTSAKKDGDHYVLNGTKRFITNAPSADIFTLMARTDPDTPGAKGISAFIVERKSDGLTIGTPDKKMGQQGAKTADVIMEARRGERPYSAINDGTTAEAENQSPSAATVQNASNASDRTLVPSASPEVIQPLPQTSLSDGHEIVLGTA